MRVAGLINFLINGDVYQAKGNFTYNLGHPKREAITGADGVHGYKETPQVSFIEGEITDRGELNLKTLLLMKDATVTLELANGKVIVQRNAWYAADGNAQTEEANIQYRSESAQQGEEVRG